MPSQLWLIRHGETEWTLSGAHTGSTDIPLTHAGRCQALKLRESRQAVLSHWCWPALFRARQTCDLAGFGEAAQIEPNLVEWRYGDYEGRTTDEIHAQAPGWSLRQYLRIDAMPSSLTCSIGLSPPLARSTPPLLADGTA